MPTQSGRSNDRPLFLRFREIFWRTMLVATPQTGIMELNKAHSHGPRTAAIENIQAGDMVWAWDEETGEIV